ncbi:MAG: two-component system sensor histidine kinase PfeS [Lentisphaeria bacterium]|jgi:two-component system sensor histidine kinase PfeS
MKYRLLWKLCAILALGTVALFGLMNVLCSHFDQQISCLNKIHQEELLTYGKTAKHILSTQGETELAKWVDDLQIKENTWVSVVASEIKVLPGNPLDPNFVREHQLGQGTDLKIHLYFDCNPIMDVPPKWWIKTFFD